MISKCIYCILGTVLSTGNFLKKDILASILKRLLIWGDRRAREMHTENYKIIKKSKLTQTDGDMCHVLGLEETLLSK